MGDSYVLVRSTVGKFLLDGEERYDNAAIAEALGARYPGKRVHVLSALDCPGRWHYHLDMTSALFPLSRCFVIDTHNGGWNEEELARFSERENVTVLRFDGKSSGVWHPLNIPSFPYGDGEAAIIDSQARSLRALLEAEGIVVKSAGMPQVEYPSGRINCQTNTFDLGDDYRTLLERF